MKGKDLAMRGLVALVLASTAGCLPPAAWTKKGYVSDVSRRTESASIVGRCFRLLTDVGVYPMRRFIDPARGEPFEVRGSIFVPSAARPLRPGRAVLPKGSPIFVERIISRETIKTRQLTPYARIDDAWMDTGDLFRYGARRLVPGRRLAPCDDPVAPAAATQPDDALRLPAEVAGIAGRLASCAHFAGEFSGDGSPRDAQINRTMTELRCDTLEHEAASLRRRYPDDRRVETALAVPES